MDSPLRLGVANLVRQRGAGEISRDSFFEELAALQTAVTGTPWTGIGAGAAYDGMPSVYGLGDSWASEEGILPPTNFVSATPFDSVDLSMQQSLAHGLSATGEGTHDWSSGAHLLTGADARALILGRNNHLRHAVEAWTAPGSSAASHTQPSSVPFSQDPPAFGARLDRALGGDLLPPTATPSPTSAWPLNPRAFPEAWGHPDEVQWFDSQSEQEDVTSAFNRFLPERWPGLPQGAAFARVLGDSAGYIPLASPSHPHGRASTGSSSRSPSPHPNDSSPVDSSFASAPSRIGLRRSVGSDSPYASFTQRSEVWEKQRAQRCQELRRQRDEQEMSECPFFPARAQKRSTSSATSSTRCRGSSRGSSTGGLSSRAAAALGTRLSRPMSGMSRDALIARAEREREELKECTFQPDISKSSRSRQLCTSSSAASLNTSTGEAAISDFGQSFVRGCRSLSADAARGKATTSGARICRPQPRLFVPVTNSVHKDMVNARAYLAEDVFSRLMQPSPEMLSQSCSSISGSPTRQSHRESRGNGGKSSEVCTTSKCQSAASRSDESFISFLHRQNTCEEWRRERLSSIKAATDPPHRPVLCDRSIQLADRHRARRERSLEKGGIDTNAAAKEPAKEQECSFRPQITEAAKQRERRSLSELSAGDQRRREAKMDRLREQFAKEMKDETFAPHFYNTVEGVQSRLRVLQDPDSYLERVAKARSIQATRCEQERKRLLAKEAAECTFKPQVKSAPQFVQRMAESYRLVRSLKEKENESLDQCSDSTSRPEWR